MHMWCNGQEEQKGETQDAAWPALQSPRGSTDSRPHQTDCKVDNLNNISKRESESQILLVFLKFNCKNI